MGLPNKQASVTPLLPFSLEWGLQDYRARTQPGFYVNAGDQTPVLLVVQKPLPTELLLQPPT